MAKARGKGKWIHNQVIRIHVKGRLTVIGQMLIEPWIAFFRYFSEDTETVPEALDRKAFLFCCPVTQQFLKHSLIDVLDAQPVADLEVPRLRIAAYTGTRRRVVWEGTRHQREFFTLEAESGGRLIDRDPAAPASAGTGTLVRELEPRDWKQVQGIELDTIWTFPLLNERLKLIHELGENVDPLKELRFDREMRPEYRTFIDILASHGSLEDWGYSK